MRGARRGELWLADLGSTPSGSHLQLGKVPVVVVQTDDMQAMNTVVIIPLTTQLARANYPHNVLILAGEAGQQADSVALCHQIRAIDRSMLVHPIGELSIEKVSEIEAALLGVLEIPIFPN